MALAAQASYPPIDLGELDRYLRSDDAPPDCMQLSELDGFLTGIAVSPDLITPSEWLPIVWDEQTPFFADDRQAEAVVDAVMARYRQIVDQLKDGSFQPELSNADASNTDEWMLIASEWADGFALAMALRPFEWEKLGKSPAGMLLFPILLLGSDYEDEDDPLMELDPAQQEDAVREAIGNIPMSVKGIADYWQMSRSEKRSFNAAIRAGMGVGRNDPCPCGSGRKFKKCCAAAA